MSRRKKNVDKRSLGQGFRLMRKLEIRKKLKVLRYPGWVGVCLEGSRFGSEKVLFSEKQKKEGTMLKEKVEIYTVVPYCDSESSLEDWTHISRNEKSEHVEYVFDIEELVSPDFHRSKLAEELSHSSERFKHLRLHRVLDFLPKVRHQDFILWVGKALVNRGKFEFICRSPGFILAAWMLNGLGLLSDFLLVDKESVEEVHCLLGTGVAKVFNKRLKTFSEAKDLSEIVRAELGSDPVSDSIGGQISEEAQFNDSRNYKGIPEQLLFENWLNQQLFSSGVGFPTDSFKSLNSLQHVVSLCRRGGLRVEESGFHEDGRTFYVRGFKQESLFMELVKKPEQPEQRKTVVLK